MDKDVSDARSRKIIFLSHCCLNQNAKVQGIAKYPGAITPLVELLLHYNVGMWQMPCPEMTYIGAMRWGQVKDQYNSPMFRRHCLKISEMVLDQAEEYLRAGYEVLGFIMIDGSPVCGLLKTPRPESGETLWGGMVWNVPSSSSFPERGVYCEVLMEEAATRGLEDKLFLSIPEVEDIGSMDEALVEIKNIL